MKTKLLINGKRYSVNLAGAKYLFNWNSENTPDTPVVPDVPTYKLQNFEYDLMSYNDSSEFTRDEGYDGISEISLTSNWAYQECNMERFNSSVYGFAFALDNCAIDFIGQTTPSIEIFSNDNIYGGTWKLVHIGHWESWVPDNLGMPDSTYNTFQYFLKFVKVDQLSGAAAVAYFGYASSIQKVICIKVYNVDLLGLSDYTYGDSFASAPYYLFDPSYTKVKITYQYQQN